MVRLVQSLKASSSMYLTLLVRNRDLRFAQPWNASLPMLLTDNYWVLLIANAVMCLPFPIINALQLGFIFGKTPDTMQGRITVTLTVPAQALSAFCSATAGSLLPALGFSGTMLVFWAVMLVSMLLIVSSRSLRTIPRADQWDRTPLE